MPLIELVVAVCLITSPDTCKEERFYFADNASLMGCMMNAQPFIADWTRTHGQWSVQRWTCGYPETKGQKA